MHIFARVGLIGSLIAMSIAMAACGDGDGPGSQPDAAPVDAPDTAPQITACPTIPGTASALVAGGRLIGQTPSHLYLVKRGTGALWSWPKPSGIATLLAPLEPGLDVHLVSAEMIFSLPTYNGARAQVTTFDGQHFLLDPPTGATFDAAAAAPGGATYVSTRGSTGVPDAIYRVRASTRSLELVRTLGARISALQAQDDALYWLQSRTAGRYEVIEAKLDPPSQRVLLAEAPRDPYLEILGGKLFVNFLSATGDFVLEQRALATGVLEKSFPSVPLAAPRPVASLDGHIYQGFPATTDATGPICSGPSLLELREQERVRLSVVGATPLLAGEGVLYLMEVYQGCCASGVCHPGSEAVACYRP
jgi:hypothetical protein